jgi:glycosyl transferase family 2
MSSERDAFRKEIQDLFAAGDLGRCRARLAAGLQKWPSDPEILNDSGVVAFSEGKLYDAIGLFRAALALRPGDSEASENLLRAFLGEGLNHAAWQFLRETGRTCESLPHAPEAARVAVAVTVPGTGRSVAADDLDRCLAAVRAQSHPVSDVIVVLPAGMLADAPALAAPGVRRLDVDRVGAPSARRASILATRAEAIVWVDGDVALDPLWIEIALRELYSGECAGAAGRLLEVHERTLGDQWRAVHESADPGLVAKEPQSALHGGAVIYRTDALAEACASDSTGVGLLDREIGASFRRRGLLLRACSDAIAWRHRRDTLESVLDDWCAEESARLEAEGAFSSTPPLSSLVTLRGHYATLAFDRLHADVTAGRPHLGYVDFLLYQWAILRDLQHLARAGRVSPAASAAAGARFLSDAWRALDRVPAIPSALLDAAGRRVLSGLGEFGRAVASDVSRLEAAAAPPAEPSPLAGLSDTLVSVSEAFGPVLAQVWNAVAAVEHTQVLAGV